MARKKEFYYYNQKGQQISERVLSIQPAVIVSERKLPRGLKGVPAKDLPRLAQNLLPGTAMDIVVADMRAIKESKFILKGTKQRRDKVEKAVEEALQNAQHPQQPGLDQYYCFGLPELLGGGRLWVLPGHVAEFPKNEEKR